MKYQLLDIQSNTKNDRHSLNQYYWKNQYIFSIAIELSSLLYVLVIYSELQLLRPKNEEKQNIEMNFVYTLNRYQYV